MKKRPTKSIFGERSIYFIFEKQDFWRNHKIIALLEKEGIDMRSPSRVILEIPLDTTQPELIEPKIYKESTKGEMTGHQPPSHLKIEHLLSSHKPLLSKDFYILSQPKKLENMRELGEELSYFIGELLNYRKHTKIIRKIFKFITCFKDLKSYKNKLSADERAYEDSSRRPKECFYFHSSLESMFSSCGKTSYQKKIEVIFYNDQEMITILLTNPRTRKIAARSFVSFSELFKEFKLNQKADSMEAEYFNVEYSPEIDTLSITFDLTLCYSRTNLPQIPQDLGEKIFLDESKRTGIPKENNDRGEIEERRKLIFQVFGVFKSGGARKVVVRPIDSKTHSLVGMHQQGLLRFFETSSQFQMKILSRRVTSYRFYSSSGKNFEKIRKRAILEVKTAGIDSSVLKMDKGAGFPDSGIKKVQVIDQNTLLVVGSTKFMLIDSTSGDLLSSCDYSLDLELGYNSWRVTQDLIVKCSYNPARDLVVFKVDSATQEEGLFSQVGVLDLSQFEQLYRVEGILGLAKVSDEEYDAILKVFWIESNEITIAAPSIFYLKFKAGIGLKNSSDLIVISGKPIFKLKSYFLGIANHKGGNWDINFNPISGFKIDFLSLTKSTAGALNQTDRNLTQLTMNFGQIELDGTFRKTKIYGSYVYIDCDSVLSPRLRVLKFGKIDKNGKVRSLVPIKSRQMESWTEVFFDEVTDLKRIFCFVEQENRSSVVLKVLNQSLEEVSIIQIQGIARVVKCEAIDENRIFLAALEKSQSEFIKKNAKTFILDLKQKVIRRPVGEDGKQISGIPRLFCDQRLICFQKYTDFSDYLSQSIFDGSDGIFISD